MQELIAITQKALQSQSWKMKAQGAAAMASIAKQTSSLVPPHLGTVLSALLQGLPGRTWIGKVKTNCHLASVSPALGLEAGSSVFFVTEGNIQEVRFREPSVCPALGAESSAY